MAQTGLFKIGARADSTTSGFWDGQIDEVRVMARALSQAEVQDIMYPDEVYSQTEQTVSTKYYFAGGRLAMRTNGTLHYLLSDHLGSTSVTADANGDFVSEMRYKPWGETRYMSGTLGTDYLYTGQRRDDIGLYYFKARWYDSSLGRFIQSDTIIPNLRNPMAFDRYSYVYNNPLRYIDPTGHYDVEGDKCGPDGCSLLDSGDTGTSGDGGDGDNGPGGGGDDSDGGGGNDLPDSLSDLPNEAWGSLDRVDRSRDVWMLICHTGGWWGSKCPDARSLVVWLLLQEGGIYYNHLVEGRNPMTLIYKARHAIVGWARYLFDDGSITPLDLANFTTTFNPDSGGAFTKGDLAEWYEKPAPYFFTDLDDIYWDRGPLMDGDRIVDHWWSPNEELPCTACYIFFSVIIPDAVSNIKGDDIMYFGYLP